MDNKGIVFCRCANSDILDSDKRARMERLLETSGLPVSYINDLCGFCSGKNRNADMESVKNSEFIIACRPRAVRALLRYACGNTERLENITCYDLRAAAPEEILAALPEPDKKESAEQSEIPNAEPPEWPPWYPVIDEERCTRCGKCRDYCLFGVYNTKQDGRIIVESPRSCKNLCPACARICPTGAIIFPKHNEAPFDGSPVSGDYVPEQREEVQTEILRRRILNRKRKRELLKERLS